MNKQELIKSLDDVYCRLMPSEQGVGLFAIRDIPKGVDATKGCFSGEYIGIKPEELEGQPAEIIKYVKDFCAFQDGEYWMNEKGMNAIDPSFFMNNSREPNIATIDEGENFVTIREIKKGEEITSAYDTYDDNDAAKLNE